MSFDPDSNHQWLFIQSSGSALTALAYETALIRYLPYYHDQAEHSTLYHIVHYYPLATPTILLGAKDTRLANYKEAVQYLQGQNYQVLVRPHGGLGIVCDAGIINLSLIQDMRYQTLTIDQAYQNFIDWLQSVLQDLPIKLENYEMPNSYCPGKYDLIVKDKKIGGIAQRRFRHGVTTAAYLSLTGNQSQRGQVMKEFYHRGQADASYPQIDPDSMANLSDFLEEELSPEGFLRLLQRKIVFADDKKFLHQSTVWQTLYDQANQQIRQRSL